MKRIYQYFFRGLLTALPLGLTVYLLYTFLTWAEHIAMWWVRPIIGDFYIPGLGLTMGLGGIVLLGYLVSHKQIYKLLALVEFPFTNLPVVKSIYSSLKSFADYFAPHKKEGGSQQAVILRIPGHTQEPEHTLEIVGLITRQNTDALPAGFIQGDRVAVYLPMGYMIGGYTVFVPSSWLTPIDMSVEEVMSASLFAWMSKSEQAK